MAKLIIPESLQRFSEQAVLDLPIDALSQLSPVLAEQAPRLHAILYVGDALHGFVNLYLNDQPIVSAADQIRLHADDVIELVASVSGG